MKIPVHKIENYTYAHHLDVRGVPVVKRGNYFVDDSVTVDGDAPKKFVGIYDRQLLGHKHKSNKNNWIRYIAKTGHKWYPIESITELLLNRLGMIFGLNMAESRLVMMGGQLRFLSRYFLNPNKEELVHGADILAGYLNETSPLFVEEVVRSIDGSFQPYFSPVYDTARGLFWNYSEDKVNDIVEINKTTDAHIRKYCQESRPKIGWEGEKKLNHFKLFEKIYTNEFYVSRQEIRELLASPLLGQMVAEVRHDFCTLMTKNRIMMICKCLEYRFNELRRIL